MQEQFFVRFDKPIDPGQIGLALRSKGVAAPDLEMLDAQRREQYLPLLSPVRGRAIGVLQAVLICAVTTVCGLTAVIVENAGYLLSLFAVAVIWFTMRRAPASRPGQVFSVRVEASDAAAARSALVQFGAAAMLGPLV